MIKNTLIFYDFDKKSINFATYFKTTYLSILYN